MKEPLEFTQAESSDLSKVWSPSAVSTYGCTTPIIGFLGGKKKKLLIVTDIKFRRAAQGDLLCIFRDQQPAEV